MTTENDEAHLWLAVTNLTRVMTTQIGALDHLDDALVDVVQDVVHRLGLGLVGGHVDGGVGQQRQHALRRVVARRPTQPRLDVAVDLLQIGQSLPVAFDALVAFVLARFPLRFCPSKK